VDRPKPLLVSLTSPAAEPLHRLDADDISALRHRL
jgi:hypothetical protein